jgi:hypothetical protein
VAYDYRQARDRIFGVTRENGKVIAFEAGATTPAERLLLLALVEFAPNIEPSTVLLARMMNVDERQVRRLLRSLEQKGRLLVEQRAGQRSRYHLTDADPGHHVPPNPGHGVPPDEPSPRTPCPPTPDTTSGGPRTPRPPKQTSKADKKADNDLEPFRLHSSEPPKKKAPKADRKPRVARWTRIPAEWQPTPEHRALAAELGVNFDGELENFRDHEFRSPKSDGDACFRTWLRNAKNFARGGGNGVHRSGPRQPNHGAFDASAYEA